ncbi:MAG: MopE-related protein [Myxococcota bacterium]
MVVRVGLLLALALAGCVASPSLPGAGDAVDRFLAEYPASVDVGCEGGDLTVSWSVAAHPLVDRYEAVLTASGAEVERLDLGFEGTGSAALAADVVEACTPCDLALIAVDAAGAPSDVLLEVLASADADGDGFAAATCGGTDCDDGAPAVFPGAEEACDGVDNDCSGALDDLPGAPLASLQAGVCAGAVQVCDGAGGFVDPDYAALFATWEADETTCDGLDNDCDGTVDDVASPPLASLQAGVCAGAVQVCDGVGGWVEPDYAAIPGYEPAETQCDGVDSDCSGIVDDLAGAPLASLQAGVCAGARQVCDGSGGFVEPDYSGLPGYEADEVTCDGLDNDCDGTPDDLGTAPLAALQDGVCAGTLQVCDGQGGWMEPDYAGVVGYEVIERACDGLDNDCNGTSDDILPGDVPPATLQDGVCSGAMQVCAGTGWEEPDYTAIPGYELAESLCDGLDNDCDGDADLALPGAPAADLQLGVCAGTRKTCDGAGGFVEPDYAAVVAGFEASELTCDGLDNDCDGVDDDVPPASAPLASLQDGVCSGSLQVCAGASGWVEPDYGLLPGYEPVETLCDGLDNDCDAALDVTYAVDPATAELVCWGDHPRSVPDRVIDGPWASVATPRVAYSAQTSACALDPAGGLWCWGANGYGELGDDTYVSRRTPAEVAGGGTWSHVALGRLKACGLKSDGTLWCWGATLGESLTVNVGLPVQVGSATYQSLDVGDLHACAIATDDTLWCWGADTSRQLGLAAAGPQTAPAQVGADTWEAVSTGAAHTCGLRSDSSIWCWGANDRGQLGANPSGTPGPTATPVQVAHPTGAVWRSVSAGGESTCARDDADAAWCWGAGNVGELGRGVAGDSFTPVEVLGGPYTQVVAAELHGCGVSGGQQKCWGLGFADELGNGSYTSELTPVVIGTDLGGFVAPGANLSCALAGTDAAIWCWGDNDRVFGTGPGPDRVTSRWSGEVRAVASGEEHVCFVDDADGSVWCMGRNERGQLGTGDLVDTVEPVQVATGDFVTVSAGDAFTCALESTGARWCWGRNQGRIGNGSGPNVLTPWMDPVGGWQALDSGGDETCAIAADSTLYCWGSGSTGTPTQQDTTVWSSVTRGPTSTCAIDPTGTLMCWGVNSKGQLGVGNTTSVAYAGRMPVVEPGPWRAVSMGDQHVCALKTDDSLWCWGNNQHGELGADLFVNSRAYPVPVAGAWSSVSAGQEHTCAVKTDGTTWCWGDNFHNQLAREYDDDADYQRSPALVGATNATVIGAGDARTCVGRAELVLGTCSP